jgi:hypothetical protein
MASRVTAALQEAVRQEDDLAKYAKRVQLAVDTPLEEFKKLSPPRFHCITMIQFLKHCIVIDLTAQATPFKVNLQSIYACQAALNFLKPGSMDGPMYGMRMSPDLITRVRSSSTSPLLKTSPESGSTELTTGRTLKAVHWPLS